MSNKKSYSKRAIKASLLSSRKDIRCCFCRLLLSFQSATLEHIIPLALDGSWDRSNLSLSCSKCNNERGTADFNAFRDWKRGIAKTPPPMANLEKKQSLEDILNALSDKFQTSKTATNGPTETRSSS